MTHLIEVHASFIGIGKSTFIKQMNLPQVDDCIDLALCFDQWYHDSIIFSDLVTDEIVKSLLAMENTITKIISNCNQNIILASRSPVLSAFQFLPVCSSEKIADKFIYYYKTRLSRHVNKITILDYGDCILSNETWMKMAYERMLKRNRKMEIDFFTDYELYRKFFETCEKRKKIVINKLKQDSFFEYIQISKFNGFNTKDLLALYKIVYK